MPLFLLVFVAAPLIELYLLIRVGGLIGAGPTILLALFTAALGGYLVRAQGFKVVARVRAMLARGETPAFEMLDGALLLLCGFALLLPGFVTDSVGFLLLVPPLRHALIRRYARLGPAVATPPARGFIEGEYRRDRD